jgi:nicotinamidase-related amidase
MTDERARLLAQLQDLHPVAPGAAIAASRIGLVVVDVVNGFCTPGAGALAPIQADPSIDRMVDAIDDLAKRLAARRAPFYVVRDQHEAERPERPFPPHCIRGSGEENLVDRLAWLSGYEETEEHVKDCNNLIVAAQELDGRNAFFEWINRNRLQQVVFTGICTDICVADPVLSLLSAANHQAAQRGGDPIGIVPSVEQVIVYAPGCATYDLPRASVEALGLPPKATHDAAVAHHTGLWLMQSRGATIVDRLEI